MAHMRNFCWEEAAAAFRAAESSSPSSWRSGFYARVTEAVEALSSLQTSTSALASSAASALRAAPAMAALSASVVLLGVGGLSGAGEGVASPWATRVQLQTEQSSVQLTPGVTQRKFLKKIVRTTRTGAPIEELRESVSKLETNRERTGVTQRLLDELSVTSDAKRSAVISDLVWRAWFFHESPFVQALIASGQSSMAEGDLLSAEMYFMNAAFQDPGYAEAWNRLATVHYLMGDQNLSLVEIRKTLELEPLHFGALSGRGMVNMQLERYGEAAQAFREAQAVLPASAGLAENIVDADALAARAESLGEVQSARLQVKP